MYTDSPSPEIALRRLLLENVLLLAGRRVPADTNLDVTNAEVKNQIYKDYISGANSLTIIHRPSKFLRENLVALF